MKNSNFVGLLPFLFLCILSCNRDTVCNSTLFATTENKLFIAIEPNFQVRKKQYCFYRYSLKNSQTGVAKKSYWLVKNDTFFTSKEENMHFNSPVKDPFICKSSKKGDYFSYYTSVQVNDSIVLFKNLVKVYVEDVVIGDYDTVFNITYASVPNSVPKTAMKGQGEIVRYVTFSSRYGITDFSEEKTGDTRELEFDW